GAVQQLPPPVEKGKRARSPAIVIRLKRNAKERSVPGDVLQLKQAAEARQPGGGRTRERPQCALQTLKPEGAAVIVIACKRLIAAFAGEQYLYVFRCQARHVEEGDGRRLANRLFHVPNVVGQELLKFLRADGQLVVLASIGFRRQTRIRPLVDDSWGRK